MLLLNLVNNRFTDSPTYHLRRLLAINMEHGPLVQEHANGEVLVPFCQFHFLFLT